MLINEKHEVSLSLELKSKQETSDLLLAKLCLAETFSLDIPS